MDLEGRRRQYRSREHVVGKRRALALASPTDACPHCGLPLGPIRADLLDYDHLPDRSGYRGLSHRRCNRREGARNGAAVVNQRRSGEDGDGYQPARAW